MNLKYLTLFLFLFLCLYTRAQVKGLDTTEHKRYPIDVQYVTYISNDYFNRVDTTLNNFFLHRPVENCFTCMDLGNIGLPSFDGRFNAQTSPELQTGIHVFDNALFSLNDLRFIKVRRPYTDLFYTLGSKNEQIFQATLAERIKNNLYAGGNMRYASATGLYSRQKAPFNNFSGYIQYTGKKQHFTARAGFVVNRLRAPINGGVANDTFINDPQITQKIIEPVRSDTSVNKVKQTGFVWQSSYDIGHLSIDTSKKTPLYTLDKRLRIENTFTYQKTKYLFTDDSSDAINYFVSFPRNSIQDSITEHKFTEELGLKYYHHKHPNTYSAFSGGVNYIRLFQPLAHNNYTQYYLKASNNGIIYSIVKHSNSIYQAHYTLDGQYAVSNINTSYLFSETLHFNIDENSKNIDPEISRRLSTKPIPYHHHDINIGLLFTQSSTPPALLQNNYQTTLYQWWYNYKNIIAINSEWYLNYKNVKLRITNSRLTNYIYYGLDALPHQYTGALTITQASLKTRLRLWGHFYTADEVLCQKISNTDIVNLPTIVVRTQLYFESDAFKKASHVQLGIMVRYWSDYCTPDYMAATMQFYLQQEKVYKVIPVGDVFASMQIKTAQLFLRFANVGSYFTNNINFGALHYPMPDAGIHFGVKWILWN